jgi:PKHD-type hydroxylase
MLVRIDNVLSQEELDTLRSQLAGLKFEDGRSTAGEIAQRVKHNLQITVDREPRARPAADLVTAAVNRNKTFTSATLPSKMSTPMFNFHETGMKYGNHVDNAIAGSQVFRMRTDIAVTVFLSQPEDYDGGELTVEDTYGVRRIKLPAGSAIVYPARSVHRVEPITRGTRLAAVFWVQSMVRDDARRNILFDIDVVVNSLSKRSSDLPEITALSSCYHNLLREWGEV